MFAGHWKPTVERWKPQQLWVHGGEVPGWSALFYNSPCFSSISARSRTWAAANVGWTLFILQAMFIPIYTTTEWHSFMHELKERKKKKPCSFQFARSHEQHLFSGDWVSASTWSCIIANNAGTLFWRGAPCKINQRSLMLIGCRFIKRFTIVNSASNGMPLSCYTIFPNHGIQSPGYT